MIPKVIHYCWFGHNPLPALAKRCIESWKKYLPDYEIKEWNEDNFNVNIIPYTSEAYKAKKYAFVSDYARFWILYHYGGVYFDTDVEIIKNMDSIIDNGSFMGYEHNPIPEKSIFGEIAPGLGLGVETGDAFIGKILEHYSCLSFFNKDGSQNSETIVTITTSLFKEAGLKPTAGIQTINGFTIYTKEYFCPKDYITGKLEIDENTVSIHHYGASWYPWYAKLEMRISHLFGLEYRDFLHRNIPKIRSFFKRHVFKLFI